MSPAVVFSRERLIVDSSTVDNHTPYAQSQMAEAIGINMAAAAASAIADRFLLLRGRITSSTTQSSNMSCVMMNDAN
eukprot:scaffold78040_cov49-Cyclotella_meneghiniana.AAC.9